MSKRGPRVGFLWDSLSDNLGDRAIGTVFQRLAAARGVDGSFQPVAPGAEAAACDLLVIGGGELLHPPGHGYYDCFRVPGEHVLCAAGTSGPVEAGYLDDYRLVSVRSRADRKNLGGGDSEASETGVRVAPCLTLLYDRVLPESASMAPTAGSAGAIGLHLSAASLDPAEGPALLETLRSHLEPPIAFLSFTHYNRDARIQRILAAELGAGELLTPEGPDDAFAAIRDLRAVVTTSLHATLFAYVAGTPFLALAYAPKVEHFLTERGLGARCLADVAELEAKLDLLEPGTVDWSEQLAADRAAAEGLLDDVLREVDSATGARSRNRSAGSPSWRPPSHPEHAHVQMMALAGTYGEAMADRLELVCELDRAARHANSLDGLLEAEEAERRGMAKHQEELEADVAATKGELSRAAAHAADLEGQLAAVAAEHLQASDHVRHVETQLAALEAELERVAAWARSLEKALQGVQGGGAAAERDEPVRQQADD